MLLMVNLVIVGGWVIVLFFFGEIMVIDIKFGEFVWIDGVLCGFCMLVLFGLVDVLVSLVVVGNIVYVIGVVGWIVVVDVCIG